MKNTFASHSFRAKTFAGGNWAGLGAVLPWIVAALKSPETGVLIGKGFQGGAQAGRIPRTGAIVGRGAKYED